jgi:hypothetical protein
MHSADPISTCQLLQAGGIVSSSSRESSNQRLKSPHGRPLLSRFESDNYHKSLPSSLVRWGAGTLSFQYLAYSALVEP